MATMSRDVTTGQFRLSLVGRTVESVRFEVDPLDDDESWTVLRLDDGREIHIRDESPWVWIDADAN